MLILFFSDPSISGTLHHQVHFMDYVANCVAGTTSSSDEISSCTPSTESIVKGGFYSVKIKRLPQQLEDLTNNRQRKHVNLLHENLPAKTKLIASAESQSYCTKNTIRKLKKEMRTSTSEISFKCEVCEKSFSSVSLFVKHQVICKGVKYFRCLVCKKPFKCKENFERHKMRHTGRMPFKCQLCGRAFKRKVDFNRHKKTHTRDEKSVSFVRNY